VTKQESSSTDATNRRDFIRTSMAAAVAGSLGSVPPVHATGRDTIRVGLIGCGSRGTGAAQNCTAAAPENVKLVAMGDAFKSQLDGAREALRNSIRDNYEVADDNCFVGLDAYKGVINSGVDYVILATPPGFRPLHIEAAVAAGKNIFTEKPVAVDGPGVRKVLAAYEKAIKNGLGIAAGTQRRHQAGYIETMKQIHDGAIGNIVAARCYWNGSGIWFRPRQPGMSDVVYQIHNWYHFVWLCGDHICEQHVHNLDVINWAMNAHPVRCTGMGGRTPGNSVARPAGDPNEVGHIFDHFAVEYEYPNGARMFSQCRHIPGCWNSVSEHLVGANGTASMDDGKKLWVIDGKMPWRYRGNNKPYEQEHADLVESILAGKPINELRNVAESSLTAIMGRMAAYTGKEVSWEQALNSKLDTFPANLSWDMKLPVSPTPIPGQTELI
jgi:predicted dehydrogenase